MYLCAQCDGKNGVYMFCKQQHVGLQSECQDEPFPDRPGANKPSQFSQLLRSNSSSHYMGKICSLAMSRSLLSSEQIHWLSLSQSYCHLSGTKHTSSGFGFFFTLGVNCVLEKQSIWLIIFVMSAVLKILKESIPRHLM